MPTRLDIEIAPQPDATTCGPTCLHAVYRYYGDETSLGGLVDEIAPLPTGGTLAVDLANHALARGYDATIYTFDLNLFDPTWFTTPGISIRERLQTQLAAKPHVPRLALATERVLTYLELGGRLRFDVLTPALLRKQLLKGRPVLTGLSATFLYQMSRERPMDDVADNIHGHPVGHFVVLAGYHPVQRLVTVADPFTDHPLSAASHLYNVDIDRVIGAIYLGVLTYDGNLLMITPRANRK